MILVFITSWYRARQQRDVAETEQILAEMNPNQGKASAQTVDASVFEMSKFDKQVLQDMSIDEKELYNHIASLDSKKNKQSEKPTTNTTSATFNQAEHDVEPTL